MKWQIALALFFVCSTTGNLLRRTFSKKTEHDAGLISFMVHTAIILPLSLVWALFQKTPLLIFTPSFIVYSFLAGVAGTAFSILAFKSQKTVDAAQFAVISNLSTPLVAVLSALSLRESLNISQAAGMVLIMGGVSVVTGIGTSGSRAAKKHIWFAVAGAVMTSFAIILERFAIRLTSIAAYFVIGFSMQAITMAFLARKKVRVIHKIPASDLRVITLMGVARFGSTVMFLVAVKNSNNVSLVSAASGFRTVVICTGSYLFLGERERLWQKLLGSCIATAGLFLM